MNPRALIGQELFSILSRSAGFLFLVFVKKINVVVKNKSITIFHSLLHSRFLLSSCNAPPHLVSHENDETMVVVSSSLLILL